MCRLATSFFVSAPNLRVLILLLRSGTHTFHTIIPIQVLQSCVSSTEMAAILPTATTESPPSESNLFESFRGMKLPVEVCLKIVEDVIYIDPKIIRVLMRLSKVGLCFLFCGFPYGKMLMLSPAVPILAYGLRIFHHEEARSRSEYTLPNSGIFHFA